MKIAIKNELGEVLITQELQPKTFKSGSKGEYANFKVSQNGSRYQVNVIAVLIGSKPATTKATATGKGK